MTPTKAQLAMRWVAKLWCEWTHGGGHIKRDAKGRINWQCSKCGRWSDYPVPLDEERRMTDRDIARARKGGRVR